MNPIEKDRVRYRPALHDGTPYGKEPLQGKIPSGKENQPTRLAFKMGDCPKGDAGDYREDFFVKQVGNNSQEVPTVSLHSTFGSRAREDRPHFVDRRTSNSDVVKVILRHTWNLLAESNMGPAQELLPSQRN